MAISANQGSQRATSKQEPGITHFIPNKKQSAALPPGTYLHSRLGDYFYWKEADKAGYNYLKPTQISTLENFVDIKERALAKRHTAVTDGNEVSSRSNAVLELSLVDANRVVQGVITMVDLFGSEEATAGNSDSSERNLERGKATNHIGELDQYLKDISKGNAGSRD
ncbi:hypothetical protein P171DRAFT_449846 [Karstenula rhodostoma CBS 690.94]|uniref:Kinesin motor domain-containing protein n=1 Tax=Karstenula rhodostoma CBS 690.94 TaxID=1392251 RepID=A0A9P4P6V8_9PLEO|nr:hypothetical protein P171DRAFT_449846 [Karstenula rhodostoma CBS 690.94]